jgi:dephospho-CoA kinase
MAEMKQIKPRVVAVVGAKGAGKDELADYLVQEYGVLAVEVGEFARKLARDANKDEPLCYDVSAKNLAEYGPEHVMQQLVAEILESEQRAPQALIIMGVRTPAEAAVLKDNFGSDLLLVYIKVGDQATRYERVQKRDFATDSGDFEKFVQEDEQLKSDYSMATTAALADIILWNQGSLPAYHQQIKTHIVSHLFPK